MMKTITVFQRVCLVGGFFMLAAAAMLGWASGPAAAAPLYQLTPFPTPTPGPDGRILYIVQPGDTLWRIAAISGVSIDELRALNNLTGDGLSEGRPLLLGLGGPVQATALPAQPTPTSGAPTPTPDPGDISAEICVLIFNDLNGNTLRDVGEFAIPRSIISVSDRAGLVNLAADMLDQRDEFDDPLPACFPDLEPGAYNITVAIPDGYNPTTVLNYALQLDPSTVANLAFGAQVSTAGIISAPPPEEVGQSPILGVFGALLVLAGIGVGIAAMRMGRPKPLRPMQ